MLLSSENIVNKSEVEEKVVIVDDNREIRDLLCEFLIYEDFAAEGMESGEALLHYLTKNKLPKMILLDLSLVGMSGVEVMNNLNLRKDRGLMKVFIASGWDDLGRRAKELQADGFICKPFDLDKLEVVIKSVVSPKVN